MRSDDYYVNLDRKVKQQEIEREQLEVAIKEYLAKGGKITHVPVGGQKQGFQLQPTAVEDPLGYGKDVATLLWLPTM